MRTSLEVALELEQIRKRPNCLFAAIVVSYDRDGMWIAQQVIYEMDGNVEDVVNRLNEHATDGGRPLGVIVVDTQTDGEGLRFGYAVYPDSENPILAEKRLIQNLEDTKNRWQEKQPGQ